MNTFSIGVMQFSKVKRKKENIKNSQYPIKTYFIYAFDKGEAVLQSIIWSPTAIPIPNTRFEYK